jgi:hypothetical protein
LRDTKGTQTVLGRHRCGWGSFFGGVEGDLHLDFDVPAGDVDVFDDQAEQGEFDSLIWPHLVGLIWLHLVVVYGSRDGLIWPHLVDTPGRL